MAQGIECLQASKCAGLQGSKCAGLQPSKCAGCTSPVKEVQLSAAADWKLAPLSVRAQQGWRAFIICMHQICHPISCRQSVAYIGWRISSLVGVPENGSGWCCLALAVEQWVPCCRRVCMCRVVWLPRRLWFV